MMRETGPSAPRAEELVAELGRLRQQDPVGNDLLALADEDALEIEHLRRLAGVELQSHVAEVAAFGAVIARFPTSPAADVFLDAARLTYDAHFKLRACAAELGVPEDRIGRWPVGLTTSASPGFTSWLAAHGSQADLALALHTDLTVYFPGCAELVDRIRKNGTEVPESFVTYYSGGESEQMNHKALLAAEHGLRQGDDPRLALTRARLMEEHIGRFWAAAAGQD